MTRTYRQQLFCSWVSIMLRIFLLILLSFPIKHELFQVSKKKIFMSLMETISSSWVTQNPNTSMQWHPLQLKLRPTNTGVDLLLVTFQLPLWSDSSLPPRLQHQRLQRASQHTLKEMLHPEVRAKWGNTLLIGSVFFLPLFVLFRIYFLESVFSMGGKQSRVNGFIEVKLQRLKG